MPKQIPDDLQDSLDRIASGKSLSHRNNGAIFHNREGLLPPQPYGYDLEYVHPTVGINGPGGQSVVVGQAGDVTFPQTATKPSFQ
jgi:filamentous hemagglutinin